MSGKAFLVLGMHRSGTSAVARLLNLAGAAISEQLMQPQADNPKGFWESLPITQLHDQALAGMGLAWDRVERVPDDWFRSAEAGTFRAALKAQLQADFPEARSFVVKDPRACRFVPAWLQVLAELRYTTVAILPVRNPLEVARSLERRNGFPVAKSLLLWLRHVLDAEASTRQVPRALVDYGCLLDDWRTELSDVSRQLGFTCVAQTAAFEEQVDQYLSRDDRHHVASAHAVREADRIGWVAAAFAALHQLRRPADTDARQAAIATLDQARDWLDGVEAVMDPFLAAYRRELHRAASAEAEARAALGRRQLELDEARQEAGNRRDDVSRLRAQVEGRDQALTRVRADLERTRSLLATRTDQLADASACLRQLQEQLAAEPSVRAEAEALRADVQQLRLAAEHAAREALRTAAAGHARLRHGESPRGRPEAFLRLLTDAQVRPSRWLAEPLCSVRNLVRLGRREYRHRVTQLARCGLFDPAFYARTLPGVSANLTERFLLFGDAAGERPHLLFDPEWYRRTNPDIPQAAPALQHYLTSGGWELRSPHPLFDPGFYLSQWVPADVEGLSPFSHFSPLSHFLDIGGSAGASPHPLFDAFHYLRARPDLAAAGVNPLLHYLAAPAGEAADPHPLFSNQYYLERHPDVEGISALEHFVRHGAAEGRSPHPLFDVHYYWHQRPDVRASGVNPLQHFLTLGASEGTDPHPLFSCRHYESQCGGDWDRRENPLVHYLRWGRQDARHPHPDFDTRRYLEAHPDVASSGLDPLVHYVLYGTAAAATS
jgi:hypothetical protein